ncbi:MAG: hypothetical protein ND866_19445 [Pyrinomonadaceae bacterium]|nr:hypothetical protein [Pyrinomonadaceae bacterium]
MPISKLPVLVTFCAIIWLCTNAALAQISVAEFHEVLREKVNFDQTDFTALQQGQTVVKLLPAQDKREVAVSGLVSLQVPAELFLQSFRENMSRKSNPAILEIGSFGSQPTLDDLKDLSFENHDIEDLKKCVVGDCQLKLSAMMIERFHKEVDWEAPDYRSQAAHLLKVMLLDYVRDYLTRGEVALIEYHDKAKTVRLAEEQRALRVSSSYIYDVLDEFSHFVKSASRPNLANVENAIVWSKMKFGLKPVIAINHITIYKLDKETGPQILIASKQIYANHYFDSSLGLTAFVNIPGAGPGSFLLYENRSRADGLQGMFGKIKRGVVEERAVDSLRAVLENSKVSLNARMLSQTESAQSVDGKRSWRRWKVGGLRLLLGFLITAFVALYAMSNYRWNSVANGRAHD